MRIIPLLFLMILSHVAFAERPLDGMYVTGGGFISETQVDFLGSEKEISDTRPMIFVGYGKTSRMINDTQWRVFLGIEGFYMGDSKTERGSDSITREVPIPGDSNDEDRAVPVETRSYSIKQGDTYGAGIRVGLYERYQDNAGSLYAMLGYAKTELEGQGTITDLDDIPILSIPQQDLDFTGYYYGIGYEYAFNTHWFNTRWALRVDYIKYDYSKETFDVVPGASPIDTTLSDPGRVELDQNGLFIGLTGRF